MTVLLERYLSPHISAIYREDTIAAVELKLDILDQWTQNDIPWLKDADGNFVRDKEGELILDYFPKRLVQFASWIYLDNCVATRQEYPNLLRIQRVARSTLNQPYHAVLRGRVDDTLELLRIKSNNQVQISSKTSLLEREKSKSEYWKMLAEKLSSDLLSYRLRMQSTEVKLRKAERAIENGRLEHQRITSELNARIAELTLLVAKVLPIQKGKNDA